MGEAQRIAGDIGDISPEGSPPPLLGVLFLHHANSQSQETVNLAHPAQAGALISLRALTLMREDASAKGQAGQSANHNCKHIQAQPKPKVMRTEITRLKRQLTRHLESL